MKSGDDIMAQLSKDLNLARLRVAAMQDIANLSAQLRGMGFAPELEGHSNDTTIELVLRVDLFACAPEGSGAAADPVDEGAPPPSNRVWGVSPDGCAFRNLRDGVGTCDCGATVKIGCQYPPCPQKATVSPVPVAKPEPAKPASRKEWTDAECKGVLTLADRGVTYEEIARRLGRSKQAVSVKLVQLRKAQAESAEKPAPKPAPPVAPTSGPAPAKAVASPAAPPKAPLAPPSDGLTERQRVIGARMARLGNPDPFTPEVDLKLARALVNGEGLAGAVEATDGAISRDDLRDRWRAMLPEVTLDDQAALIRVLTLRAQSVGTKPGAA